MIDCAMYVLFLCEVIELSGVKCVAPWGNGSALHIRQVIPMGASLRVHSKSTRRQDFHNLIESATTQLDLTWL